MKYYGYEITLSTTGNGNEAYMKLDYPILGLHGLRIRSTVALASLTIDAASSKPRTTSGITGKTGTSPSYDATNLGAFDGGDAVLNRRMIRGTVSGVLSTSGGTVRGTFTERIGGATEFTGIITAATIVYGHSTSGPSVALTTSSGLDTTDSMVFTHEFVSNARTMTAQAAAVSLVGPGHLLFTTDVPANTTVEVLPVILEDTPMFSKCLALRNSAAVSGTVFVTVAGA